MLVAASIKGGYTTLGAYGTPLAICDGGTRRIMACLFLARLRATYSWPGAKKYRVEKSSPMRDSVCPWGFAYCQGVPKAERESVHD